MNLKSKTMNKELIFLGVLCILIGGAVLLTPNGLIVIVSNPVSRIVVGAAILGAGAYAIAKTRQLIAKV